MDLELDVRPHADEQPLEDGPAVALDAQADTAAYGVQDGDRVNLRVKSDCGAVLEALLVRMGPSIKLEVHIDTDEGNAVNYAKATGFELFK